MFFSTFLPAAFPALAIAHFAALLSPGQDFFLIVAHALRHKLRGSQYICLGVALGNAVYIAVAIVGWTSIRDNTMLFSLVEVLGASYLMWLGIGLLKSKNHGVALEADNTEAPSVMRQLVLGISSAILNPKNALFYMSLMTVILGSDVTFAQQVICGVWMFFAVLFWDLLIAIVIGWPMVQKTLKQSVHIIERGAGCILIAFSMFLFIDYLPV
ncbi:LysE family translocator [Vibrio sp. 99-8-1]|uniref:LysE family translocator n=1 Tax=Vibrio sp. 99-8-1 TaxID=2607602 RepID=UPI001493A338|nr:LysE family translocator [Vibrio sp. 99-8-1]NOI65760.1 LysE family translocator [Vibrio sp. 99-8-1]